MTGKKPLSLYVHIPFCIKKCLYCDFLSFPLKSQTHNIENYVNQLCCEIEYKNSQYSSEEYRVISVFFGGGTPSSIDACYIEKILCKLRNVFPFDKDAEITIEVNPGTVDEDKLTTYYKAGINRLSFGLQSACDEELKTLGRIHNYDTFEKNYALARRVGFTNINVDLMSAIPNQTVASWEWNLNQIIRLNPEHISAYSLIVEEGTPFYDTELKLPSEEDERAMYAMTGDKLLTAGYEQYEISNYGKPGFECKHNIVYWKRGDYLGFGLSAASLVGNLRISNVTSMEDYLLGQYEDTETKELLSLQEEMGEAMFLGLRMTEGVSEEAFVKRYGITISDQYPGVIEKYVRQGLLERRNGHIFLTKEGMNLANAVMCEFV
ncbi:MAG: oxygen-independent coproporphyrinogen III oxidase [Lachnospiraceae bacterium]|nr:oxygen-independent coproporphyrinogen III oxidase [Lachnospiraceae bacterium]